MINRRQLPKLLCIVAVSILIQSPLCLPAQAAPSGERLRNLAGTFFIGYASADNFLTLSDHDTYTATARSEFNILTPENAMKWATIHRENRSTYNFAPADQHVQFAQANNLKVHGHTLLWADDSRLPSWVSQASWTAADLTTVLFEHIDTVVGHYRGQVAVWDVVNEAFSADGTGNYRTSIWYTTIGQKYIELAFQRARAADPSAKLIYNDFSIETLGPKSDAVYRMILDFKARGIPIDGVGFQMHLPSSGLNYQSLADNMRRFADQGLEIYVTEMDVRLPLPVTQTNLNNQATVYRNVLNTCLAQPACKALQMWGFTDNHSWIPQNFTGFGAALIFDENYNPKPAYSALQSGLIANPRTSFSDCLFNWAERTYPALFAPATTSNTLTPYYYRYYSQTSAYLAISSADNHVYYLGSISNNAILDVGPLTTWQTTTSCQ
jgi:endo-1,4-beta-xylanase